MANSHSQKSDVKADLARAEQQCHGNGARLTNKRKQVLEVVLRLQKAASAYDIIDGFDEQYGEKLPPTSMYRILDFLEQEQLVHKLQLANKYVACTHIRCCDHHQASQFLICSQCNKVKEVVLAEEIFEQLKQSSRAAGFQIQQPHLEVNCLCDNCQPL